MRVLFQSIASLAEQKVDVLIDSTLKESRGAVQMLLGLEESESFNFLLERTNSLLSDDSTFRDAGVRESDKLILVPLDFEITTDSSDSLSTESSQSDSDKKPEKSNSWKKILPLTVGVFSITAIPLIGISYAYFNTNSKLKLAEQELENIRENLQDTQEKLQEQQDLNQSLTKDKDELEDTISGQDAELERQRGILEKKENELEEREAALSTSRNQLNSEQRKTATLNSNINTLKQCMEGMAGAFIAIDEENAALAISSLGRIETTCEEAGDIIDDLE